MGCGALCNWGAVGNRWDWIVGVLLAAAPAASAGGGQASGGQDGPPTRPPSRSRRPRPPGPAGRWAARRRDAIPRARALRRRGRAPREAGRAESQDVEALALLGTARVQLHQYEEGRAAFAKIACNHPRRRACDDRPRRRARKVGKPRRGGGVARSGDCQGSQARRGALRRGQLAARRSRKRQSQGSPRARARDRAVGLPLPAAHYALSQIAVAEGTPPMPRKSATSTNAPSMGREALGAQKRLAVEPNDASACRALATLYARGGRRPVFARAPRPPRARLSQGCEAADRDLRVARDRGGSQGGGRGRRRGAPDRSQLCGLVSAGGAPGAGGRGPPLALSSLEKALDLDPAASAEPRCASSWWRSSTKRRPQNQRSRSAPRRSRSAWAIDGIRGDRLAGDREHAGAPAHHPAVHRLNVGEAGAHEDRRRLRRAPPSCKW